MYQLKEDGIVFNVVHLEMLIILVAIHVFTPHCSKNCLLLKCNNDAIVNILNSGHVVYEFLGACTHIIWYDAAINYIGVTYMHVWYKANTMVLQL